MEDKGNGIIAAFDSLFTTNKIQMLKVMFSRLSPSSRGHFAVYIKFMELQYTLHYSHTHASIHFPGPGKPLSFSFLDGDNTAALEFLDELLPFSGPDESKKIEGFKNMLSSLQQMKEMMDMMQMMQEMFPEGDAGDGGTPADILSGLSGMGNMDMSSLFEMFQGNK